jgi:hypothetical protein
MGAGAYIVLALLRVAAYVLIEVRGWFGVAEGYTVSLHESAYGALSILAFFESLFVFLPTVVCLIVLHRLGRSMGPVGYRLLAGFSLSLVPIAVFSFFLPGIHIYLALHIVNQVVLVLVTPRPRRNPDDLGW